MNFVLFYHSLLSDWNHGNAHFLRGIASELLAAGHDVQVYEPADGWSLRHLLAEQGSGALRDFHAAYAGLTSHAYDLASLDADAAVGQADVVLVHEWNEPQLVRQVGRAARESGAVVLFHDTHHRLAANPRGLASEDLRDYDGVLAFGEAVRERYVQRGWTERAWTWHEAADTRRFHPIAGHPREGDLIWVGNWGDEERSAELHEFLLEPVAALRLSVRVYGVRYPPQALQALSAAGIDYAGWLPNYRVPEVFARFPATVHVPRRMYAQELPGIPTIRMFEALACGIALVSAPWEDCEHLFEPGVDYLVARDGTEMRRHLSSLLQDGALAQAIGEHGRRTILRRHTCAHRVAELLGIVEQIRGAARPYAAREVSSAPGVQR